MQVAVRVVVIVTMVVVVMIVVMAMVVVIVTMVVVVVIVVMAMGVVMVMGTVGMVMGVTLALDRHSRSVASANRAHQATSRSFTRISSPATGSSLPPPQRGQGSSRASISTSVMQS